MFRVQLAVCISNIIKHDFPGRWTQIVDKITIYLQNPDASCWSGALHALHQLVKNYEYVHLILHFPFTQYRELFDALILMLGTRKQTREDR